MFSSSSSPAHHNPLWEVRILAEWWLYSGQCSGSSVSTSITSSGRRPEEAWRWRKWEEMGPLSLQSNVYTKGGSAVDEGCRNRIIGPLSANFWLALQQISVEYHTSMYDGVHAIPLTSRTTIRYKLGLTMYILERRTSKALPTPRKLI